MFRPSANVWGRMLNAKADFNRNGFSDRQGVCVTFCEKSLYLSTVLIATGRANQNSREADMSWAHQYGRTWSHPPLVHCCVGKQSCHTDWKSQTCSARNSKVGKSYSCLPKRNRKISNYWLISNSSMKNTALFFGGMETGLLLPKRSKVIAICSLRCLQRNRHRLDGGFMRSSKEKRPQRTEAIYFKPIRA